MQAQDYPYYPLSFDNYQDMSPLLWVRSVSKTRSEKSQQTCINTLAFIQVHSVNLWKSNNEIPAFYFYFSNVALSRKFSISPSQSSISNVSVKSISVMFRFGFGSANFKSFGRNTYSKIIAKFRIKTTKNLKCLKYASK